MRVIFTLCLGIASAFAQPLSAPEIDELLRKLAERRGDSGLSVDFREERSLALLERPIVETGRLEFLPPNKFRKEVALPTKAFTVCDGETLWIVFPGDNEAERYSLSSNRRLRDSMSALTAAIGLSRMETAFRINAEKDGGLFRLELMPRRSSLKESVSVIRVVLRGDLSLEEIVIEAPGGNRTVINVTNERPLALSAADFRFEPPPRMKVSTPLGE